MIRTEHINQEVEKAKKVIEDSNTDTNVKVSVLFKLITVMLKILVNIRTNTSLIMKKLGIEFVTPTKKDNKKESK